MEPENITGVLGTFQNEVRLPAFVLSVNDLDLLIQTLARHGYRVMGPTLRDSAIVYEEIHEIKDLPLGWTEEKKAGVYRLKRTSGKSVFGFTTGPTSWKSYLLPSQRLLWRAQRKPTGNDFEITVPEEEKIRQAFLGVRACDLAAIQILDHVLLHGPFQDATYRTRRGNTFIIAVNCTHVSSSCFCQSTGSYPPVKKAFDIALTEIMEEERHEFLVEIGSEAGRQIIFEVPTRPAEKVDYETAEEAVVRALSKMQRSINIREVQDSLLEHLDHTRWEQTAERCLACGNCTLVCPTCFCATIEDTTDLTGSFAERWERWDSCFTLDFSYIHGGSVRNTIKSRYRQWLTHKLSNWHKQFGMSGCVGCGRCIVWCPVGIDITEEAKAICTGSQKPTTRQDSGLARE